MKSIDESMLQWMKMKVLMDVWLQGLVVVFVHDVVSMLSMLRMVVVV